MSDWSNRVASGPAADLWKKTLSQIPTHFGRLVYVASLREAGGHYFYRPLIESMGREITDRTLASSHYSVFAEWITFPLAAQKADLDEYLRGPGKSTNLSGYRDLVPATVHEVERQLYITDLETLLSMIRFESESSSPQIA